MILSARSGAPRASASSQTPSLFISSIERPNSATVRPLKSRSSAPMEIVANPADAKASAAAAPMMTGADDQDIGDVSHQVGRLNHCPNMARVLFSVQPRAA